MKRVSLWTSETPLDFVPSCLIASSSLQTSLTFLATALPLPLANLHPPQRCPSSGEEMPSPEEVYFTDSPVLFVFSLLAISQRDGFIAHPADWGSLSPARPFSQRVKHWFVNGGKHSGPCLECHGSLLLLCVHTHTHPYYTPPRLKDNMKATELKGLNPTTEERG